MNEETNNNADLNNSNLSALDMKHYLSNLLDSEPFNFIAFKTLVEDFNKKTEQQKDYKDCFITIERINRRYGNLRVYNYEGTGKIKFEVQFLR